MELFLVYWLLDLWDWSFGRSFRWEICFGKNRISLLCVWVVECGVGFGWIGNCWGGGWEEEEGGELEGG